MRLKLTSRMTSSQGNVDISGKLQVGPRDHLKQIQQFWNHRLVYKVTRRILRTLGRNAVSVVSHCSKDMALSTRFFLEASHEFMFCVLRIDSSKPKHVKMNL